MDYISVKEAAQKFQLSERRVQKLCETNRIDGCTMVSGIWLIPAMAKSLLMKDYPLHQNQKTI